VGRPGWKFSNESFPSDDDDDDDDDDVSPASQLVKALANERVHTHHRSVNVHCIKYDETRERLQGSCHPSRIAAADAARARPLVLPPW